MSINKNVKWLKYLLLLFYFIYLPNFLLISGIPIRSELVVSIGVIWVWSKILLSKLYGKRLLIYWTSNLRFIYLIILSSSFYFLIIALVNENDPRIIQNSFVLFHLFIIIYLINRVIKVNNNKEDGIRILLQVAAFQGLLSIATYIFSSLKNIALNLYYLGSEENIFISRLRIFGFSGEYTFFTPVYHGLLLSIIVYLFLFKKKNYLKYFPLIFIASFLNGRTGIIISLFCVMFMIIVYGLINFTKIYKTLFIVIILTIIFIGALSITQVVLPDTYNWILNSFNDIYVLLTQGETVGTIDVLSDMFLLPSGIDFIFGKGLRLYGNELGLPHSDIGYVNDMFMGGIIYVFLQYFGIFLYLFNYKKENRNISNYVLSTILFATFLIANYKGEVARSGLVLIGILITKYLIVDIETANKIGSSGVTKSTTSSMVNVLKREHI